MESIKQAELEKKKNKIINEINSFSDNISSNDLLNSPLLSEVRYILANKIDEVCLNLFIKLKRIDRTPENIWKIWSRVYDTNEENAKKYFIDWLTWQDKIKWFQKVSSIHRYMYVFRNFFGGEEGFRENFVKLASIKQKIKCFVHLKNNNLEILKEFFGGEKGFRENFVNNKSVTSKHRIQCFKKIWFGDFEVLYKLFGGEKNFKRKFVDKASPNQKYEVFEKLPIRDANKNAIEILFGSIEKFYKETNENQRYLFLRILDDSSKNEIEQKN